MLVLAVLMTVACVQSRPGAPIVIAEEKTMTRCVYLETLAETSDMGKPQLHPKFTYDARERILHRADQLGATHLVWLHDNPFGSAGRAYRCPQ